ncbi:PAS domain S-box protein [Methanobacterium sp.]|uniref:PAS domain S-box protein n=1 Tax=Methanobacterium sp. TaxID=2164 RepID=UPI003C78A7B4
MKEKRVKYQQKDSENLENKFEKSGNFDSEIFQMLFEVNTSVLTLLDPYSGKIIDANPAAVKFYGYSREKLCSMNINEINMLPYEKIHDAMISGISGGSNFIFPHKLANGKIRTVEVFNSSIVYKGKVILFNIIHDITPRIEMEKSLRKSEEKYRTLFEEDPNYTILLETDGTILEVNKKTTKLLGIPKKELIGKNYSIFTKPGDIEFRKDKINSVLQGKLVEPFEFKFINMKGETYWIKVNLKPVVNNEKVIYIILIGIDITEHKKAENIIKTSLNDKSILLKEIHHRVKNNMQIISSLLNLQTEYVDDEETINVLRESQNRVKSMAIIHENLYKSKDLTHINFVDYIRSLVSNLFYSYDVKEAQIKLTLKIEDISLNIETAIPCGLIISELISNSLKYAFPNKMNGEIIISLKYKKDTYQLCICDNGIGLPEHINFNNIKTLGLLLVESLTGQIDGDLTIYRDHGTQYKITFKELIYKERF